MHQPEDVPTDVQVIRARAAMLRDAERGSSVLARMATEPLGLTSQKQSFFDARTQTVLMNDYLTARREWEEVAPFRPRKDVSAG